MICRCRSSWSVSGPRANASSRDRLRGLAERVDADHRRAVDLRPGGGRSRSGDRRAARAEGRSGRAALAPPRRTTPRRRARPLAAAHRASPSQSLGEPSPVAKRRNETGTFRPQASLRDPSRGQAKGYRSATNSRAELVRSPNDVTKVRLFVHRGRCETRHVVRPRVTEVQRTIHRAARSPGVSTSATRAGSTSTSTTSRSAYVR